MAEQDPPLKPKKDESIESLLNKDSRMMRSPVLWFVLLSIPVLLAFYIGLTQSIPNAAEPAPVVEYTPEEQASEALPGSASEQPGAPTAPSPGGRVNPQMQEGMPALAAEEAQGGRQQPVVCGYQDWVGKHADSALEDELKAKKQAYRIMPIGSMMTMDFSAQRINFETDAGGIITRVWCG